ncbi:MAG: alternative ribosome rescue aminoacyl-tRNA hydrolase ArfB [Chloroflexota bacterium]|nr:alternative ribosome rescue aminoacyl-tRNA hydrolase ArfB [Chloroflexota bacterium]
MTDKDIIINRNITIPFNELRFRYARSSGPGGQHAQRTETKVELLFDLATTPSLGEQQRKRAMSRLKGRLDNDGILHLTSQAGRSQHENREDVIGRFRDLLSTALKRPKKRRSTKPSAAARRRRLEAKRRRSEKKKRRGPITSEE